MDVTELAVRLDRTRPNDGCDRTRRAARPNSPCGLTELAVRLDRTRPNDGCDRTCFELAAEVAASFTKWMGGNFDR
jgi:hypothetical protein